MGRPVSGAVQPSDCQPSSMAHSAPPAWLHHLKDEADAAFLYRELALAEPDPARGEIYRALADVEDRHLAVRQRLLAEQGHEVVRPNPSGPARLMAWLGRRIGSHVLLPFLLEEEGRGVKGALQMHPEASP